MLFFPRSTHVGTRQGAPPLQPSVSLPAARRAQRVKSFCQICEVFVFVQSMLYFLIIFDYSVIFVEDDYVSCFTFIKE